MKLLAVVWLSLATPALAQQAPRAPQRAVSDPGVIATNQRVTPAGVQTVLQGRVTGVRFGPHAGELWVVVPGSAYRLDWSSNRVVMRGVFDGRAGVHGVTYDVTGGRALVSSVGRLPAGITESRLPGSAPLTNARAIAQLSAFGGDASGDSTRPLLSSGVLGDYMAGAPAVARRPGASGRRIAVVTLPANDRLAILDADRDSLIASVPVGVAPIDAVLADDGSVAWVSSLGGAAPKPGQRSATECCDPRAERVRTDASGLAAAGHVVRVNVATGRATDTVTVGHHPTGLAWDQTGGRLYVADGNDDAVSVVDTKRTTRLGTIPIAPFHQRKTGLTPTALALSADGHTLYVALGGINAVAVFDVRGATSGGGATLGVMRGLIPTGWYPSSIDVSPDGARLAVGSLFGVGSGEGTTGGAGGKRGRYVFATRGSVNVIDVPTAAQLSAHTTAVAQNNRLALASTGIAAADSLAARRGVTPRPIPERPGEPSPIQHVVFIIKENRTYDQVFGDLGRGAGDSSLVMYGRDVTPNQHALAEQFVTLDHFFASGGNSADGHQWLTQANETEYPMWPLYFGRSYPSEGNDPLAYSAGGFLWETAQAKGKSVAVFGEYAPAPSDSIPAVRRTLMTQYLAQREPRPAFFRDLLRSRYKTHSEIPSLDRVLVREYPGWTQEVPDVVKADVIIDHLREWESVKKMPNLVMIILPSDHTVGTTPGWCTPRACVADNDYALGKLVDSFSHSSFWESMAMLVVEDDAQDGVDHIDGHRTVALAVSPYARRGIVDSTFYNQPSMVKTVELILGLPALSLFDLTANDMRASFLDAGAKPNLAAFTAIEPRQRLDEMNQRVGSITGPHAAERRSAALASSRMRFDVPDAAPSERLNRILWHEAKGWNRPYPGVRHSLFFPMSVDLADDEREEKRRK